MRRSEDERVDVKTAVARDPHAALARVAVDDELESAADERAEVLQIVRHEERAHRAGHEQLMTAFVDDDSHVLARGVFALRDVDDDVERADVRVARNPRDRHTIGLGVRDRGARQTGELVDRVAILPRNVQLHAIADGHLDLTLEDDVARKSVVNDHGSDENGKHRLSDTPMMADLGSVRRETVRNEVESGSTSDASVDRSRARRAKSRVLNL